MNAMSLGEFLQLLDRAHKKHSLTDGHAIKYVRPHYDNRTGTIFAVDFEEFGWKMGFRADYGGEPLFDQIYNWLSEAE